MNAQQRRKQRRLPKKEAFLQRNQDQKQKDNKNKELNTGKDSVLTSKMAMLDYLRGSPHGKTELFDIRRAC